MPAGPIIPKQWWWKQLRFGMAKVEQNWCTREARMQNFWPHPQIYLLRLHDCALGGV